MLDSIIVPLGMFLNGLLAGLFLGSCMVEQAERTLPGPHWLAYKQAKEALFGPVMPAIFGVVLIASIVIAILSTHHLAFAITCALLAVALAITVAIHLPLNTAFQSWTAETLPAEWDTARRRWRVWNWVRGAFAVAAFAATFLMVR